MDEGGDAILRQVVGKALSLGDGANDRHLELEKRRDEIDRRIDELIENLTATNREFVDRKLAALKDERAKIADVLVNLETRRNRRCNLGHVVEEALQSIREFEEVFDEGTLEEQKELVALMVERVDVDPVGKIARCRIRKFPAPTCVDTGNLLRVVAGAGFEPATFGL